MLASMRGHPEAVAALLKAGASKDCLTCPAEISDKLVEDGLIRVKPETALDYAGRYGHPEIVEMLTAA